MESRKIVQMNLFAKQKQRHRLRVKIYGYQGGRWARMNWEIGVDIYALPCVKQITNENLQYILQNLLGALW